MARRTRDFPDWIEAPTMALIWLVGALLGGSCAAAADATDSVQTRGAESYLAEVWRVDDGLPGTALGQVVQTSDGYLWVRSSLGLARFDGMRFEVFGGGTTPTLRDQAVAELRPTRHWGLLAMLQDGSWLQERRGRFLEAPVPPGAKGVVEDGAGHLWWSGGAGGLWRLEGGGAARVPLPSAGDGTISLLVAHPDGAIWVRVGRDWWRCRDGRWAENGLRQPFDGDMGFAPASDGGWWQVELGRMGRIGQGPAGIEALPTKAFIFGVHADRDGGIWLATEDRAVHRRSSRGRWERIVATPALSAGIVRGFTEDGERGYWLAGDAGLVHLRPRTFRMHAVRRALETAPAHALAPARDGGVWATSFPEGVFRIANAQADGVWMDRSPRLAGVTWSVLEDRAGDLWVGTYGLGARVYGKDGMRFVQGPFAHEEHQDIHVILEDRRGRKWLGGYNGLILVETNGVARSFRVPDGLCGNSVSALAEDSEGAVWVGTLDGGISRMNGGLIEPPLDRRDGLPANLVRALAAGTNGTVWIGFDGREWARWRAGRITTFRASGATWNQGVTGMAEDGLGYLWLATRRGVHRVSLAEMEGHAEGRDIEVPTDRYDRADGLNTFECTDRAQPTVLRTADGRMWFATGNGVASVDPRRLWINTNPPPVVIVGVKVDGREVPADGELLAVAAGAAQFEVRYTAPSFVAPGRLRFRYRMEGLDPDWVEVEAGGDRSATYRWVPPGRYRFRVRAANEAGVWNEEGAGFIVEFAPTLTQRRWFRVAAGAVGVALLGFAVRRGAVRKYERRLAELERQQAVERERARLSKDIHDQLGADLTHATLLTGALRREVSAAGDRGLRQLEGVEGALRVLAQNMDALVWATHPGKDTLSDLVGYLGRYAERFLGGTEIALRLDLPPVVPAVPLRAEVRHQVYLAFKEAMNNAVKHSRAREIRVGVRLGNGWITVEVMDDGCGFDRRHAREDGQGLSNMERRLQDIGGRTEIESAAGRGTSVRLHVPVPSDSSESSDRAMAGDRGGVAG